MSSQAINRNGDDALRASVTSDQVANLYSFVPTGAAAHITLAILVTLTVWDQDNQFVAGAWLAARLTYTMAQPLLYWFYRKAQPQGNDAYRWGVYFALFAIPSGILWGLPAILFMDPALPLNTIIIVATLVGLGLGATAADAAFPPVFYAFTLPVQCLLITGIILNDLPSAFGLVALVLLGLAISSNYTKVFHQALENSARLRAQNIQLRREAEEKSALLESTLENMDQGIAMVDADNRIRMWNQHFLELLNIQTNQQTGQLKQGSDMHQILNLAHPPLPELIAEHTEYNGVDRVVEIRQTVAPHNSRVLTFTDITGRKNRESALDQARRESDQANAAKTRFLAAASHDLRQPIHALGLFFSALSEQVQGERPQHLLAQIDTTIDVIASMLNALLDISKLDAGLVKPNPSNVDLNPILQHIEAEFGLAMKQSGGSLRIRHCDFQVYSDPEILERMLRNIVANAVRYAAGGHVLVAARRRGATVHCQVIDNGSGIPEEKTRDIFLEFHQLDNPQRDRREGLGLGLAIVDRLAKLLGHQVLLQSTVGRGSCFTIVVPRSESENTQSDTPPDTPAPQASEGFQGLAVLVLDDDIVVRDAMLMLLQTWGCDVQSASTIDEALVLVKRSPPQVMLIDYRLPDNSTGIEAIAALNQTLGRQMPAAIITGDTAPDRLLQASVTNHPVLHKPVHPSKLRATLHQLIESQRTS